MSRKNFDDSELKDEELKKAGLKVTIPRLKILRILEQSNSRHMSAEELYKKFLDLGEDIGIATIYRVLTQFQAAGIVLKHNFESEHAVYEINEGAHHDHLVCIQCGRVEEFVDETIEQRQEVIAKQFGFLITNHCLYLYGTCEICMKKTQKEKESS